MTICHFPKEMFSLLLSLSASRHRHHFSPNAEPKISSVYIPTSITVSEPDDSIVYLHKLFSGLSDRVFPIVYHHVKNMFEQINSPTDSTNLKKYYAYKSQKDGIFECCSLVLEGNAATKTVKVAGIRVQVSFTPSAELPSEAFSLATKYIRRFLQRKGFQNPRI